MAVEESTVLEGGGPSTLPPSVRDSSEDADTRYQITQSLEGGMSEILQFEDAVDVMFNKLEETVETYRHKVSIETALESCISFITVNKD
jgi:hypothetical protein